MECENCEIRRPETTPVPAGGARTRNWEKLRGPPSARPPMAGNPRRERGVPPALVTSANPKAGRRSQGNAGRRGGASVGRLERWGRRQHCFKLDKLSRAELSLRSIPSWGCSAHFGPPGPPPRVSGRLSSGFPGPTPGGLSRLASAPWRTSKRWRRSERARTEWCTKPRTS